MFVFQIQPTWLVAEFNQAVSVQSIGSTFIIIVIIKQEHDYT